MKSDHQLAQERAAEARGRLLTAWQNVAQLESRRELQPDVFAAHEEELAYAMAIASEHGLDPQGVLIEAGSL